MKQNKTISEGKIIKIKCDFNSFFESVDIGNNLDIVNKKISYERKLKKEFKKQFDVNFYQWLIKL